MNLLRVLVQVVITSLFSCTSKKRILLHCCIFISFYCGIDSAELHGTPSPTQQLISNLLSTSVQETVALSQNHISSSHVACQTKDNRQTPTTTLNLDRLVCLTVGVLILIARNIARLIRYIFPSGDALAFSIGVEALLVRAGVLLSISQAVEGPSFHHALPTGTETRSL